MREAKSQRNKNFIKSFNQKLLLLPLMVLLKDL